MLQVRVLGPLDVARDGEPCPIGSPTQRLVLTLLAAAGGRPVPRPRLVDAVWSDLPPESAEATLMTYVSRLRRVLGAGAIESSPAGYALVGANIDIVEFEQLASTESGDAGQTPSASVREPLTLWTGPIFGEFHDHQFLRPDVRRVEALRDDLRARRAATLVELGDHSAAVRLLEALLVDAPLNEPAWVLLVESLAAAGRRADALRAAQRCRRSLAEVGLDPPPGLAAAEHAALVSIRPPLSGAARFGNLPLPSSTLVNRSAELASVADGLRRARIVTIMGPGGVGKTRLAIEAARRLEPWPSGGIWLCDLATAPDATTVVEVVTTALGVPLTADSETRIVELCEARPIVVLFDNCDHVIEEAARLAHAVTARSALVSILATSRTPLGVDGEQVITLAPLDPCRDGVTLFVDRARAAAADVRVEDHDAVEEVCRRLDGLPLAIEMAAPWARTMSVAELATHLDRRLDFLRAPTDPTTHRYRTLREVIGWSYDRLSELEQRVLARLALFGGSFTLDAAATVNADPGLDRSDVIAAIHALVTRSLLVSERSADGTRLRLLETVADFAREHLRTRADQQDAVLTHVGWHVNLAMRIDQGLRGPDEGRWAAVADEELSNLRTAQRHAATCCDAAAVEIPAALYVFCLERLRPDIGLWARRILDEGILLDHPDVATVFALAALGELFTGQLHEANSLARRAIAEASHLPAARFAHQAMTEIELHRGRYDEAIAHADLTIRLADTADDEYLAVHALGDRCLALGYIDPAAPETLSAVAEHRRRADALGAETPRAAADYIEGELLQDIDPRRSEALLDRCVATASSVGSAYIEGAARLSATTVRARHGDAHTARSGFVAAISHWREVGDWVHQWPTLRNHVVLLERLGAHGKAAIVFGGVESHAPPMFGEEARRVEAAQQAITAELGNEQFAAARDIGRSMSRDELVAFALDACVV